MRSAARRAAARSLRPTCTGKEEVVVEVVVAVVEKKGQDDDE